MSNLQIPDPQSCPILKQGSQGAWVVCLQNALNGIGYGPLVINGSFDLQTAELIKKFQQNVGLERDGQVGKTTWLALDKQPSLPGWEPYWPLVEMKVDNTPYTPVPQNPAPPVGQLNQAILKAALNLRGMSTAEGPDGGNNACAWTLNRVLHSAGISPLGENPNYVPSLLDALKGGRGQQISPNEALAGDLVVAYEEAHIGVALDDGCQTVLSNSSSRACFIWESDIDFDGSYGGSSTIYRLVR